MRAPMRIILIFLGKLICKIKTFLIKITDSTGKVTDHRITGQFRNKSSRIWDPHPQYLIDAFGLHLHLLLYQDGNFIPDDMKVGHLR